MRGLFQDSAVHLCHNTLQTDSARLPAKEQNEGQATAQDSCSEAIIGS